MSPHAHARIVSIDTRRPTAAAGVLCVLTGKDAAAEGIGTLMDRCRRTSAARKGIAPGGRCSRPTRCARSATASPSSWPRRLQQAQDAAELIAVEYEMLPAVTSVEEAVKPGAPAVWDDNPGNVAFTLAFGNKDATDAAFAKARHTVSLRLESNRLSANAIEPRAAIGDYNAADDAFTLYATSQNPHGNRSQLADQRAEDSGDQAARDLARRRRRLRHEVRRLSGRRAGAVGVAPSRTAGEMDVDALGSAARRHPWPRPGRARRTRARRPGQDPRPARQLDARGRIAHLRLDHGEHLFHHQARARRLRHSGAACDGEGRFHQHRPGASLSRRRTAGSDLL